jgi:hypothetical protein
MNVQPIDKYNWHSIANEDVACLISQWASAEALNNLQQLIKA